MADYLARVEIFDATGEDYENLHKAMESYGFVRTITGNTGSVSKLPTGLYVGVKSEEASTIRDEILRISRPFSSREAAIFVCIFDSWSAYTYP